MLSPSQPDITREKGARYPSVLLAVYSIWWLILAIHPEYPKDWLLENLLVFVALGLLIRFYRNLRFSDFSYTMVFIFLCIHAVGAHYTYTDAIISTVWFISSTDSSSCLPSSSFWVQGLKSGGSG